MIVIIPATGQRFLKRRLLKSFLERRGDLTVDPADIDFTLCGEKSRGNKARSITFEFGGSVTTSLDNFLRMRRPLSWKVLKC